MKSHLIAIVAALLVVGCGKAQQSSPSPEAKPEPPTAKAPDISIHEASSNGNIEAVKQHLAAGTNVDEQTSKGRTPLHFATQKGHRRIVELLIEKGADVNAIGNLLGNTPLDWAVFGRKKEIAELLRKHGGKDRHWFASEESIHVAARVGHIEAVKKHLAAGTDVNSKGNGGNGDATPMHYASRYAKKEIVELLIANGADVNAKNVDGSTPLDWAVGRRHAETANLLRKHGGKTYAELKAEGK